MPTVKGYAAATRPGTPLPGRITGLVLIVLVVTLIPYLCGYLLAPPRKAFQGALNNIGDLTQYLAAIRQGAGGAWTYTNQFTPDHATALIMYTPYLLAGHVSLALPAPVVFQLLRLLCAGTCLLALASFCRLFVGAYALRAAWLFVLLAGGLYWLALLLSPLGMVNPAGLTAPELSPLITLLISPHESLGLAGELLGFTCFLRALGAGEALWSFERSPEAPARGPWLMAAAGWFLVLALSYPFLLPTVGLVLAATVVVAARSRVRARFGAATPKRQLRAGGILFSGSRAVLIAMAPAGAVGLYYLSVFHGDPLWSHSGLTTVGRPDLGVILFAFGPLAAAAWFGTRRLWALRAAGGDAAPLALAAFPVIWAAVNACTLLLPIWQQGRQALGLSVPLALLGFMALAGPQTLATAGRVTLPALPAAALAFSAPLLVALYTAITAGGVNPGYYVPQGAMDAVSWLGAHAKSTDVVLASESFGNLVPAGCACRVVIGQQFQSFDLATRQREVLGFYAAPSRIVARSRLRAIVAREHITFYVLSPLERGLGRVPLGAMPGFALRYHAGETAIYGRVYPHG